MKLAVPWTRVVRDLQWELKTPRKYGRHLPEPLRVTLQPEINRFKSVHGTSTTHKVANVPCSLGTRGTILRPAVFDGKASEEAPLLLSLSFLMHCNCELVLSQQEGLALKMQGVPDLVPLHIGPSGALRIPLQQFSKVMVTGSTSFKTKSRNSMLMSLRFETWMERQKLVLRFRVDQFRALLHPDLCHGRARGHPSPVPPNSWARMVQKLMALVIPMNYYLENMMQTRTSNRRLVKKIVNHLNMEDLIFTRELVNAQITRCSWSTTRRTARALPWSRSARRNARGAHNRAQDINHDKVQPRWHLRKSAWCRRIGTKPRWEMFMV